ncbi:mitochondrial arginine transporter BAC1-like isoform X1 [Solanum stenotomum]|uniref:mitochondrial arginine transporter BAC1-like isoform X1 n=1 Tax=Solanum stenotomum TaxID=172797 RepID=UPI0020D14E01|nr:mitochondrial arginine transporter BAC1-like isoform X1 [Solanum stenotomum]
MEASSGYKDYVAGLMAGVATVITGHPFDTVKVKLQKYNTEAGGVKYKNGLHCATRILQTEGVKGLYRGATSSFIGMAFESSLSFGIYSQTKRFLQGEIDGGKPQPHAIVPSAAFGGAIISFILCPSELVKVSDARVPNFLLYLEYHLCNVVFQCRMQVQGTDFMVAKSTRFSGPRECALKTIQQEGLTGMFRGGLATLLRESVGNAVFFSTYEYARYFMHLQLKGASSESTQLIDVGVGLMSGGLGGIAFWSAVLPLDVAKTIIQTAPEKNHSRNPFSVLNLIYKRSGLRGCYTGLGPTLVRAFPANAAAIVAWELSAKLLGIRRDQ